MPCYKISVKSPDTCCLLPRFTVSYFLAFPSDELSEIPAPLHAVSPQSPYASVKIHLCIVVSQFALPSPPLAGPPSQSSAPFLLFFTPRGSANKLRSPFGNSFCFRRTPRFSLRLPFASSVPHLFPPRLWRFQWHQSAAAQHLRIYSIPVGLPQHKNAGSPGGDLPAEST